MKQIYIVVEGQSEQEFVNSIIAPYLIAKGALMVVPITIRTSKIGRGGFTNYEHLKSDIKRSLISKNKDLIVTMLFDFFRMPTSIPHYSACMAKQNKLDQVVALEASIGNDIADRRFVPYIQLHEFEALLFSSNGGFESYFDEEQANQTNAVITEYRNPEDINSSPETAPSKRLLSIKSDYNKVLEGNLIALEVGIETMLDKCPRFKNWIESLVGLL